MAGYIKDGVLYADAARTQRICSMKPKVSKVAATASDGMKWREVTSAARFAKAREDRELAGQLTMAVSV